MEIAAGEMGKVSVEGAHQATIPSLIASIKLNKRDRRIARRTTTADDDAMPAATGGASSSTS